MSSWTAYLLTIFAGTWVLWFGALAVTVIGGYLQAQKQKVEMQSTLERHRFALQTPSQPGWKMLAIFLLPLTITSGLLEMFPQLIPLLVSIFG
jgi:hypothetical protein